MFNYLNNLLAIPAAHASFSVGGMFSSGGINSLFHSYDNTLAGGGSVSSVETLVVNVINWFLVIVFIIAFVYLVMAGIKYITSGGDAAKATEARNAIINAIIGIVVVVLALFIVNFAIDLGKQLPSGSGGL